MKIGKFETSKKPLVIAEIGNNHEGSFGLAEELIGLAAKAGVDAVKFQTFKTELYVSRKDEARFNRLKSFELSFKDFEKLSKVAEREGVLFISTPFDLESAQFLKDIVAAYKISSGDNTFYPLLENVALTGKPIILSSGLIDLSQIRHSKDYIQKIWKKNRILQEIAILHCVTNYPVESKEANLKAIATLIRELKCPIGYSDHTMGIDACLVAVALGAQIIEKHFTIRKDYSTFRDHQLSADPDEMSRIVEIVNNTVLLLGNGQKIIQNSEKSIMPMVRRSIVAKRDLASGTKLKIEDIAWIRPSGGLAPGQEIIILGKILKQNVPAGEVLSPEMFVGLK